MQIKPLNANILVKPIPLQEEIVNGIFRPAKQWEKFIKCKVIAVGGGKKINSKTKIPIALTPGNHVLIARYNGTIIYVDHVEYRFIKPIEVLVVIED